MVYPALSTITSLLLATAVTFVAGVTRFPQPLRTLCPRPLFSATVPGEKCRSWALALRNVDALLRGNAASAAALGVNMNALVCWTRAIDKNAVTHIMSATRLLLEGRNELDAIASLRGVQRESTALWLRSPAEKFRVELSVIMMLVCWSTRRPILRVRILKKGFGWF